MLRHSGTLLFIVKTHVFFDNHIHKASVLNIVSFQSFNYLQFNIFSDLKVHVINRRSHLHLWSGPTSNKLSVNEILFTTRSYVIFTLLININIITPYIICIYNIYAYNRLSRIFFKCTSVKWPRKKMYCNMKWNRRNKEVNLVS